MNLRAEVHTGATCDHPNCGRRYYGHLHTGFPYLQQTALNNNEARAAGWSISSNGLTHYCPVHWRADV